MTRATRIQRLRRAGQFVLDALSGRLGVLMMTLSYAAFAVVLLGYVSTQVYTNSLMEDVGARKREERELKDRIGRLTAQYASLASRARVSEYCEKRLDMVEAEGGQVIRVSVDAATVLAGTSEFVERQVWVSDVLGAELSGLTEVMQK